MSTLAVTATWHSSAPAALVYAALLDAESWTSWTSYYEVEWELPAGVERPARVRLRLLRTTATLICEVYDGSATSPRIRRARPTDEGGRGLQLIAALSHRWGSRFTPTGKLISTELPLPTADSVRQPAITAS